MLTDFPHKETEGSGAGQVRYWHLISCPAGLCLFACGSTPRPGLDLIQGLAVPIWSSAHANA